MPVTNSTTAPVAAWKRLVATWTARVMLGGVFLWAAVPKLQDPLGFTAAIENYHLLPAGLAPWVAVALPILEVCVAAALLVPRLHRGACLLALTLLTGFTLAMVQAMARDIDLDCGCFGTSSEIGVGWGSVARNLALALLALWVLRSSIVPPQRDDVTLQR